MYIIHILENYTKKCEDCNALGGIALKLTYDSSKNNEGNIYSKLFKVPPKFKFGLPTQFSCPVDAFIFLNKSLDIEAISYKSNCLDLSLGLFPFRNLENVIHIFEDCNYCKNINFTNPTNLIIKSYFPESILQADMGHFMKLMPAASMENPILTAAFTKEKHVVIAELFNVQISLFDNVVNTLVSIDGDKLSANFEIELYNKYLTEIVLTMPQTSTWNGALIMVQGKFLDVANNIPAMLANYITDNLHAIYNRSITRIKNAEIVYSKSLSQQVSATENHKKLTKSKSLTDELFQITSKSLNDQENVVKNISEELAEANEEVKVLQGMMNSICQIQKCKEICVPHEKCRPCLRTADTAIQGICQLTKKLPGVITTVKYIPKFRFEFRSRKFCASKSICAWKICVKPSVCATLPTVHLVTYKEPIFLPKIVYNVVFIKVPCARIIVQAPLTAQCCAQVGCKKHMQDYACANSNKQCRVTRGKIYEKISNEQATAALLLQRSDKENEKEASLKLQLAQLTVRKSNMDEKFAESQKSLSDVNMAVKLASTIYDKIRNDTNLDWFEKLWVAKEKNNTKQFNTLEINTVSFNTTIISESPTVLTLRVTGNIQQIGYNFSQEVTVDFARPEMSLRRAAKEITENSIINDLDYRSKRSLRYKHQTSEEGDNYLLFQTRCTNLQNLLEYIRIINQSLETLENLTTTSIKNVIKGREELSSLITEYTTIYGKPISINGEKIKKAFNNTIDITTNEEIKGTLSDEESQNLNLMKEYLNVNANFDKSIDLNIFTTWQNKMEQLHNETSSAAGHKCDGFSNCLQEVILVLEDILLETPRFISDKLLLQFATASRELLELALMENSSLQLAIEKPRSFFNIINNSELNGFWCTAPPVIIKQPPSKITPLENTTAILTCEALSNKYTSYKWKKNSNELPDQKNSTLILKNVQFYDGGKYTCEITNQVGTVKSTIAAVEVQQLPQFFLQPENVDVYVGDVNGAWFTSNATGWPHPGFRWYFRHKDSKNFTVIADRVGNEYEVSSPQPQHEGSYYCEAFNEQGTIESNIVNLTILDASALQLSQSFSVSFASILLSDESGSGEQTTYSGSGMSGYSNFDSSGSGKTEVSDSSYYSSDSGSGVIENVGDISGSGINTVKFNQFEISSFANFAKNVIISATDFISSTLENISVSNMEENISITFTVYSNKLIYPNNSSDDFIQASAKARVDWFNVIEKVKKMLTETSIAISFKDTIYNSKPNSTIVWSPQYTCPAGKQISSSNNFLCGKLYRS